MKTGIGGTMPGTNPRVDDKQSTLSRWFVNLFRNWKTRYNAQQKTSECLSSEWITTFGGQFLDDWSSPHITWEKNIEILWKMLISRYWTMDRSLQRKLSKTNYQHIKRLCRGDCFNSFICQVLVLLVVPWLCEMLFVLVFVCKQTNNQNDVFIGAILVFVKFIVIS